MSKNLEAYLRLNKARYKDQYVVLVDGKLVGKGKDIEKILKRVRKTFPKSVPFVAKVPGNEALVLRSASGTSLSAPNSVSYSAPLPLLDCDTRKLLSSCHCTSTPARIFR